MFKHIKIQDQLRLAQAEVARLKSVVGEEPAEENVGENIEEKPKKTLIEKVATVEETIDVLYGGV